METAINELDVSENKVECTRWVPRFTQAPRKETFLCLLYYICKPV